MVAICNNGAKRWDGLERLTRESWTIEARDPMPQSAERLDFWNHWNTCRAYRNDWNGWNYWNVGTVCDHRYFAILHHSAGTLPQDDRVYDDSSARCRLDLIAA